MEDTNIDIQDIGEVEYASYNVSVTDKYGVLSANSNYLSEEFWYVK